MRAPESALPRNWWGALVHPWTWRMAWRDSRSQRKRLAIFSLSIVAGITALVAIHSLKASLQNAIEKEAKALLGSDLQISSRQAISDEAVAEVATKATRISRETSFSSMLYFPTADGARLVQVRGVEGDYPFYGKVETSPRHAWTRLRNESGILLESAMLDQFSAKIGDKVKLGSIELPILGTVIKPPPRSSRFSGFAPEAYVRYADLERTGLLATNSLAFHHLHLELANEDVIGEIRKKYSEQPWRFETPDRRRENLGDALQNAQQFLGIVALVALVLGAIGVAGAIHAHISRRVTSVAILRCLGCPGDVAFSIYLAQAAALGLLGAVVGALLGVVLHVGILASFRDSLPIQIEIAPSWSVIAQTTGAGFLVCCGFALLPLLRVREISPAAALRDSLATHGARSRWVVYVLMGALLSLLTLINSADWKRGIGMTLGLAVAFLILAGLAKLLMAAARRVVRPTWPYLLRQGISNLHRPKNQTLLFLLSLGLGAFLLLTVLLSKNLILERANIQTIASSPNIYLVDVQPDQLEGVSGVVRSLGLPVLESAPMVTMRIQSVRGEPVRDLEKRGEVPRWILSREFRSTYRDRLNATEKVVEGEWIGTMADANAPVPLSLEKEIAKDLRVAVGDEMVLDVQGVPVNARVTSIREVDWTRFNLNFFMVFTPGVLENAPGFHVVTTRVPEGRSSGDLQRALVREFPNVSAIDLTLILETVRSILDQITRVISILAGFTVLAGIPILIGTLLNGRDQRLRESVLLRTIGASARQVRTILLVEYATLGVLSALAGIILAIAANTALAIFVFKASPWPNPWVLVAALIAGVAFAVIGGIALSRGVCRHSPLEILRSV
jgi:putative ABC transport system permease protein